jgi:hypothetical protein
MYGALCTIVLVYSIHLIRCPKGWSHPSSVSSWFGDGVSISSIFSQQVWGWSFHLIRLQSAGLGLEFPSHPSSVSRFGVGVSISSVFSQQVCGWSFHLIRLQSAGLGLEFPFPRCLANQGWLSSIYPGLYFVVFHLLDELPSMAGGLHLQRAFWFCWGANDLPFAPPLSVETPPPHEG